MASFNLARINANPSTNPDKLHQDQAAGWNAYCDYFLIMAIVVDENR